VGGLFKDSLSFLIEFNLGKIEKLEFIGLGFDVEHVIAEAGFLVYAYPMHPCLSISGEFRVHHLRLDMRPTPKFSYLTLGYALVLPYSVRR